MLAATAAVIAASVSLGPVARRMPLVVALPTLLLLALELARLIRHAPARDAEAPPPQPSAQCGGGASLSAGASAKAEAPRIARRQTSERVMFGWIGILLALVVAAGMAAGVPLFLLAYMRLHFGESWRASLGLSGCVALLLTAGLQYLLGLPLHPGVIAGWLEAVR
jgi:hypothetical protein